MKTGILGLLICILSTSVSAAELKLKFEEGQERKSSIELVLKGNLNIDGDFRLIGKGEGRTTTQIRTKVTGVSDKGVGTIENKLAEFDVQINAEAEIGTEKHSVEATLNQDGGKFAIDGTEQEIPSADLQEASAKSWSVQMDPKGSQVGMAVDSSGLGAEEAEQMAQLSSSISSLAGGAGLLPEGDVEAGDKWEEVLSVAELTKELSKDNPMISTLPNLGIPDMVSKYKLSELRDEGGHEMATIDNSVDFEWAEGNIPLGIVNITVRRLALKTESMVEVNNTEGYLPRVTTISNLDFDLTIMTVLGPDGPATYEAKGDLQVESTQVQN